MEKSQIRPTNNSGFTEFLLPQITIEEELVVYGYYSVRSKNEMARRVGLSPYKLRIIINCLVIIGWAKKQGNNVVLQSVKNIRKPLYVQLTKHFTKHDYRYASADYKDYLDKGY